MPVNRKLLVILVAIAAVSLFGSYALFFSAQDGGVWGTTNKGAFVQPPLHRDDLTLQIQGNQGEAGTWWIWQVVGSECAADCIARAEKLRALHALLNEEAGRLRRSLVFLQQPVRRVAPALQEALPKLVVMDSLASSPLQTGFYIIDPLGNFVFYYPHNPDGDVPARDIIKDLKRLLKVSQIG